METRSVIDQAIGVLLAHNAANADTAFGLLRAASQGRNIKIRDIADRIA